MCSSERYSQPDQHVLLIDPGRVHVHEPCVSNCLRGVIKTYLSHIMISMVIQLKRADTNWSATWPALVNLDSLRTLLAASTSLFTAGSETFLLSILADHNARRKVAIVQIIGSWRWIFTSRWRVRIFWGVKDGSYSFRQTRSWWGRPRLAEKFSHKIYFFTRFSLHTGCLLDWSIPNKSLTVN